MLESRFWRGISKSKHFPLDLPDPVEAIKLVMEQRNLTINDLVPYIATVCTRCSIASAI